MRLFIIFLFCLNLYALSDTQLNIVKTVYKTASQYKAIDGHIFNDTMASICLTESSAGKFLIGDNYHKGKEKHFLLKSFGVNQVKLETAILVMNKDKKLKAKYKRVLHKDPFAFKKYTTYLVKIEYYSDIVNRYRYKHTKRAKRVLKWAKRELRHYKKLFKPYKRFYVKDLEIAQNLISDAKFNTIIAVKYLIMNYNYAIQKRMYNPYFKAISRYNGGWQNKAYYKRVMKNMKIIRQLKRKKELK